MGSHQVEAIIHPDGRIEFRVKGIAGAGCKPIATKIAKALGVEVIEDKATAEFYDEVHVYDEEAAHDTSKVKA